jgi:hypothetical protein
MSESEQRSRLDQEHMMSRRNLVYVLDVNMGMNRWVYFKYVEMYPYLYVPVIRARLNPKS